MALESRRLETMEKNSAESFPAYKTFCLTAAAGLVGLGVAGLVAEGVVDTAEAVRDHPIGVGEREGTRKDIVAEVRHIALHVTETSANSIEQIYSIERAICYHT